MPRVPQSVSSKGPLSPQKFFTPPNKPTAILSFGDDSDNWWAGVQQCAVGVALAATLAVTALSTAQAIAVANSQQDELPSHPEQLEDIWVNPVAPIPAINVPPQQWTFEQNELPQPTVGESSGSFIRLTIPSGIPPVIYLGGESEIPAGSLYGQPDEDFWQNPVAPTPVTIYQPLPLGDPEEIPANSLHGQPDEDFWQNPTAPVPFTFLWPQPYIFDQDEQFTGLHGQPDEDYWQNWVAPTPVIFTWPQPYIFDQDEQFTGLFGQPDEDFWSPQLPPQPQVLQPAAFRDDDIIVPQPVTFTPDEDFWANPVAPLPVTFLWPQPYIFDQDEQFTGLHLLDEDYWQNWVFPTPVTFGSLYLPDPEEISANTLHGQPDEDYWLNWVAPVSPTFGRLYLPDPEEVPAQLHLLDEDYWQNPVAPVQVVLGRLYLPDPEEISANTLHGEFDEDFWANPVFPAVVTFIWPQPYIFETNDRPQPTVGESSGSFLPLLIPGATRLIYANTEAEFVPPQTIHVDEDYWQNPTAPVPVVHGKLYLPDPEEIPAHTLHGQPDEDYWSPIIPPQPWVQRAFAFTDDDVIASLIHVDEDYWLNWVAPTPVINRYPQPAWDDAVAVHPPTTLHVDEDLWQNPVRPIISGNIWTQPWLFDLAESSVTPIPPPPPPTPVPPFWLIIESISTSLEAAPFQITAALQSQSTVTTSLQATMPLPATSVQIALSLPINSPLQTLITNLVLTLD